MWAKRSGTSTRPCEDQSAVSVVIPIFVQAKKQDLPFTGDPVILSLFRDDEQIIPPVAGV